MKASKGESFGNGMNHSLMIPTWVMVLGGSGGCSPLVKFTGALGRSTHLEFQTYGNVFLMFLLCSGFSSSIRYFVLTTVKMHCKFCIEPPFINLPPYTADSKPSLTQINPLRWIGFTIVICSFQAIIIIYLTSYIYHISYN